MQSVICVGGKKFFKSELQKIISNNKISKFNIISYESRFKIEDAKRVRKIISSGLNSKSVFVISSDITIPAQNALLKTLEELPENAYFFIHVQKIDDLLKTIRSRSKILFGPNDETEVSEEIMDVIDKFLRNSNNENALKVGETLVDKRNVDEAIYYLRNKLKKSKSKQISNILKSFLSYYDKLNVNNLNLRMSVDLIFLENST